ncbi:hypothetical protein EXN66_Car002315 [Channa argus]|uniref:Uncharacterized protein n=1 Tax=Channa argus TaxID=215402 RepID=A0A6G1P8W8_CHAAH|nr:hypothetical protein EXN66_Car002315 [Channa argus]
MCLHLETLEHLFVFLSACVCVCVCEISVCCVWHIMMIESVAPDLLLAQLMIEISH